MKLNACMEFYDLYRFILKNDGILKQSLLNKILGKFTGKYIIFISTLYVKKKLIFDNRGILLEKYWPLKAYFGGKQWKW